MKIMIVGSMTFAKYMVDIKQKLEQLGHVVTMPCDTEFHVENEEIIDNLEEDFKHLTENDILRKCFKLVAQSDAILILNKPKYGVSGYIGTSTLMETGLAYYLGKKIFILHDVPSSEECRWAHEIKVMQPIIINEDLSLVK